MDGWYQRVRGVGLLCIVGLFIGGCGVAQIRYDMAVADMESARTDLEQSRMMHEALERKNEQLRSENEKVALDLEVMGAEIQRIKENHEHERALLDVHDAELEKVGQARTRKLLELQHAYRKLQSRNRALRGTVRRYQKELKETRESFPVPSPSHDAASPTESMMNENVAPESPPDTPRLNGAPGRVNLNTASVNDFVVVLGLLEPMAAKVIVNRPYRLRGELLAKRVMPHTTFDVIKDSVTAVPH